MFPYPSSSSTPSKGQNESGGRVTPDHIRKEKIGASPASAPFNKFKFYRPQEYKGHRNVVKKLSPVGMRQIESSPSNDPPFVEVHPYPQAPAIDPNQKILLDELESFKEIEKTSHQVVRNFQ